MNTLKIKLFLGAICLVIAGSASRLNAMEEKCEKKATVKVLLSDGTEFTLPMETAMLSKVFKGMIEDVYDGVNEVTIPLLNITPETFKSILEVIPFLQVDSYDFSKYLKFIAPLKLSKRIEIACAAQYLDIPALIEAIESDLAITCRLGAEDKEGMWLDEISKAFAPMYQLSLDLNRDLTKRIAKWTFPISKLRSHFIDASAQLLIKQSWDSIPKFSCLDNWIAFATKEGIRLIDLKTKEERILPVFLVDSISILPTERIAVRSGGQTIIGNLADSEEEPVFLASGEVAFSKAYVLKSEGNDAILRDGEGEVARHSHTHPVTSLSFSPDGQIIAIGYEDGTITVWHFIDGEGQIIDKTERLVGHKDRIKLLKFSPENKTLASAARGDEEVWLWNLETNEKITEFIEGPRDGDIMAIEFSPDGSTLSVIDFKYTRFFDLTNYSLKEFCHGLYFNTPSVEGCTHIGFTEHGITCANQNDFEKLSHYINNKLNVDQAMVLYLIRKGPIFLIGNSEILTSAFLSIPKDVRSWLLRTSKVLEGQPIAPLERY